MGRGKGKFRGKSRSHTTKIELFKKKHPEGRKEFSKSKGLIKHKKRIKKYEKFNDEK